MDQETYIPQLEEAIRRKDIEIERLRVQVNALIRELAEIEMCNAAYQDDIRRG